MASLPMKDCATPLEDARLLYADDYMAYVSSGVGEMGIDPPIFIRRQFPGVPPAPPSPAPSPKPPLASKWGAVWFKGLLPTAITNPVPLRGLSGKTQDIPVTQWGYAGWPPGPRPHPYKWTDPRTNITWTRAVMDGKWLYQSSVDERYYITASNLYELQGLRKDTDGLIIDSPKGTASEHWWEKEYFGVKAGWLAALGVGGYLLCKKGR